MSFLAKLMPAKAPITSESIRAEIANAEAEIAASRDKLSGALTGIALMSDSEHQKAEADIAATKRAIARLEARVNHLTDELPRVIAKEEAAAKAAADEALRQRAEACRKANTVEAKKLLASYGEHAEAIASILAKLKDMDSEREAVNAALRVDPVAEGVVGYNQIHRKHPDRQASERRKTAPHWVYDEPARLKDEPLADYPPTFVRATLDEHGNPIRPGAIYYNRFGRPVQPRLENREVVVSRIHFRPGHHENPLSAIHLPPAFAGGNTHWPRS